MPQQGCPPGGRSLPNDNRVQRYRRGGEEQHVRLCSTLWDPHQFGEILFVSLDQSAEGPPTLALPGTESLRLEVGEDG
jgi:hypothetical protein